jgi:WD40-like Beta Propeller Repeat
MRTAQPGSRRRSISAALPAVLLTALAAASCGGSSSETSSGTAGTAGTGGAHSGAGGASTGTNTGSGGDLGFGGTTPTGPFADFPEKPVLDAPDGAMPMPANIATLFGTVDSGNPAGGPCMIEPEPGTLFPNNWLRPRFKLAPVGGQNVFEIRIHAANEINDLLVYTTDPAWKMPKEMWTGLTAHLQDVPMTVTIRGATLAGDALTDKPSVGTSGDIRIAPASAAGAVVYWRTNSADGSGELKGFSAGDESVAEVLKSSQVKVAPQGQQVKCLGCHTSTPDGKYAAFKTINGTQGDALGSVQASDTGASPPFWTMASIDAMAPGALGIPSFSKAHWKDTDYTMMTSWGTGDSAQLAWFDLQANVSAQDTAFGFLARTGDAHGAIMPSFSHDGKTVVYTSTSGSADGRPTGSPTDVFVVPYADRKGGAATPIQGAADPAFNEYYPTLSSDDAFIAFNRIPDGQNTYDQPNAEVYVIPAAGGTATRIAANDPIACSGAKSPGVTNSWPKWAPEVVQVGDSTYYWLIFSSKRGNNIPQLYVSAMVVKGGQITSYPALYLWNQPSNEANHTPAWDVFKIPQPPPQ